jgi:glycosyltransferase involved in cell wall biosynthesis
VLSGIHQLLTRCEAGDAISTHAIALQRWFSKFADSRLYVEREHAGLAAGARPFTEYEPSSTDVLVLHAAIGSPLVELLGASPGRKVVDFHNFTPGYYYVQWDPPVARLLEEGPRQLARLAGSTDLALADSSFNAEQLRAIGFREVTVLPVMVDLDALDGDADEPTTERLAADRARDGARWLFVGRLCPNKGQHHLVRALALYRRHVDPHARLWLVGSDFTPSYTAALRALAVTAGVADAVDFAGSVSAAALRAYYRSADVFVSASEHEGFGVPLLEAMQCGVPVVALGRAAVPETVGDAGVLLDTPDAGELAAAARLVAEDASLRRELVRRGHEHTRRFTPAAFEDRLRDVLEPSLAEWAA